MADNTEELKEVKEPLKSTADELTISADELRDIIEKSNKEYEEILGEKTPNKGLIPKILLAVLLVLLVLVIRTISNNNKTLEEHHNTSDTIHTTIEKDEIIRSTQDLK